MTATAPVEIRSAELGDISTLHRLIGELAAEEGLPEVSATESDLREVLFGPAAFASALVADVAGESIGYALYYPKYATVSGRRGFHLEDVYVSPEHRGRRVGAQILDGLVDLAGGAGMVDWWVMRNNHRAIRFYRRIGARELDGIGVFRRDHPEAAADARLSGLSSAEGER